MFCDDISPSELGMGSDSCAEGTKRGLSLLRALGLAFSVFAAVRAFH